MRKGQYRNVFIPAVAAIRAAPSSLAIWVGFATSLSPWEAIKKGQRIEIHSLAAYDFHDLLRNEFCALVIRKYYLNRIFLKLFSCLPGGGGSGLDGMFTPCIKNLLIDQKRSKRWCKRPFQSWCWSCGLRSLNTGPEQPRPRCFNWSASFRVERKTASTAERETGGAIKISVGYS